MIKKDKMYLFKHNLLMRKCWKNKSLRVEMNNNKIQKMIKFGMTKSQTKKTLMKIKKINLLKIPKNIASI